MILLVFGGRTFGGVASEVVRLFSRIDGLHIPGRPIVRVVHGGAPGADSIGGAWAQARGIEVTVFMADWMTHGASAGPMRNLRMRNHLVESRRCGSEVAALMCPGGSGTRHMLGLLNEEKIRVIRLMPDEVCPW